MALKNPLKKEGFSFVEIAFTLLIFALVMTTLLAQQGRLFERAVGAFDNWQSLIMLKNFYNELDRKEALTEGSHKKTEDPGTFTLDITIKPTTDHPTLQEREQLRLIKAQAQWQFFGFKRQQDLLFMKVEP